MSVVNVVCCQVEVSCDELITRPEESYLPWSVFVCDLETPVNEENLDHWAEEGRGLSRQISKQ